MQSDIRIRSYLKEQFQTIVNKGLLSEVLLAHIHPLMLEERLPVVEEKINLIITD